MKNIIKLFAVAATFFALSLYGVELPRVFGDNMVLQRSQRIPVWGEFAGQSVSTEAGEDGKWRVDLESLDAESRKRRGTPRRSVQDEGEFTVLITLI